MISLTNKQIAEIVGGNVIFGNPDGEVRDVTLKSQDASEGVLFIPIIGARVDAHIFIPDVMSLGASSFTQEMDILGSIKDAGDSSCLIYTENTLKAFQTLGKYFRDRFEGTVIGVTGSVGKTTTREMIAAALSASEPVYETIKNYNSDIGTPITLCGMLDKEADAAVLEMGISDFGEMDVLADMNRPDIAVVTNIGDAHREFFKTLENTRDEKLKIVSKMGPEGKALLCGNDPYLAPMKDALPVKTYLYGTGSSNDFYAEDVRSGKEGSVFIYKHGDLEREVRLIMPGEHFVLNAVAALAVTELCGMDIDKAIHSLKSFKGQRQNTYSKSGITFIDDCYNASPASMRAALKVLAALDTSGRKFAVLGDMMELGDEENDLHRAVGEFAAELPIDEIITVGRLSENISEGAKSKVLKSGRKINILHFYDTESAAIYLKTNLSSGDMALFKASHSMGFSELLSNLNN